MYENTLATVPYLLHIANNTTNIEFKLDLVLSLGVVLIGLDNKGITTNILSKSHLNHSIKNNIIRSFSKSFAQFKALTIELTDYTETLNNEDKAYFLVSHLTAQGRAIEANVFFRYNTNDEYIIVCSNCHTETFLTADDKQLLAYKEDPIVNKDQIALSIATSQDITSLYWLETLAKTLDLDYLVPLIPYFSAPLTCHHCQKIEQVFEGIKNSVY